jgi:hypothetical protein
VCGAAVAVLGFLSAAATKNPPSSLMVNLPIAFLFFAFGALATAVALSLAYSTQLFYPLKRDALAGWIRAAVFVCVVGSYAAFVSGALRAGDVS